MTAPVLAPFIGSRADGLHSLKGRTALVTGATGALGPSIAGALAEAGARVILNARNRERLWALAEDFHARGLSADIAPFDVRDEAAAAQTLGSLAASGGRLSVLVNNALLWRPGTWRSACEEDCAAAFDTGPSAILRLVKIAEPLLHRGVAATGQAAIINIAGIDATKSPDPRRYGERGEDCPPQVAAARAAVLQLTRYLACHLAPSGIRVNAISPGRFERPGPPADAGAEARWSAAAPLGRLGRANEIKGAVLFLASDASSYVTGVNIPVDGGASAW